MSVLVLGLNHKSAPLALLERVAVSTESISKALASLMSRDHVIEAVVLSTCNRVEVYAHVTRYHGGVADLRNFMAEWGGVVPEEISDRAYEYHDERAAEHLFAVAAGLDSMIVGERQVHAQVRQALTDAEAEGSAGRVLAAMFRQAIRTGRRARAETRISEGASTMVDVALAAAERELTSLAGCRALIVGAGQMGSLAARRLQDRVGELLVANRTRERAEELARRVGATPVGLAELAVVARDVDLVLCSTGAPDIVLEADTVTEAMAGRSGRPLVIVDLAVPRDVDAGCAGIAGVELLDIEGIRSVIDTGRTAEEVARVRVIVEEEAQRFAAWRQAVRVDPTIAALRARAEAIRLSETERLAGRLGDLGPRQREALDALTRGIVNTLLHEPSVRLKELAERPGAEGYANALRELFGLD